MVYLIREVTDYCVLVIIVPEAKFRAGGWGMCKSGEAKRNRTSSGPSPITVCLGIFQVGVTYTKENTERPLLVCKVQSCGHII